MMKALLRFSIYFLILFIGLSVSTKVVFADTWNLLRTGSGQNFFASISCSDILNCHAVGNFGILATTDGGNTWISQDAPNNVGVITAVSCPSTNNCYAATLGSFSQIILTKDGGNTWSISKNRGFFRFYDVSCPSPDICYASGDEGVWVTTNGGLSWVTNGQAGGLRKISCPSITTCYGEAGSVVSKTTNSSTTWALVTDDQINTNPLFGLNCPTENTCYVVGDKTVLVTNDGGNSWVNEASSIFSAPGNLAEFRSISCASSTNCYGTAFGYGNLTTDYIFNTTDGGQTWSAVHITVPDPNNNLESTSCPAVNACYVLTQGSTVFSNIQNNQAPVINPVNNATINQGDTYSDTGSFTDSDSSSWTATVDYGDGSGVQSLSLSGTSFSLNHTYINLGNYNVTVIITDNQGASAQSSNIVSVIKQLTALSPAKIWVGLKNSDDVGVKFDLKAEAYANGSLVSSGETTSVNAGSSSFNNAKLDTINFDSFSPVSFPSGSTLSIKLYVRNACTGSGHNSGTARLWYNDSAANSQFGATIATNTNPYYLVSSASLSTSVGTGPKQTIDVQSGAKCSAYKLFGTWTGTP